MRAGRRSLAVAAAIALASCHAAPTEETATEAPVPVVTAAARLGSIREVTAATGVVTPHPDGEMLVTAPEAARIAELPGAEGDRVRAGDLLVRFEIPSLAAAAASGVAAIDQAAARVENAKAASARLAGLFERGVAARKEVEDAGRELREAEAALAQARSASGAARALAGRLVVRARFAGVIAKRWHHPGDFVEPGPADPILRVIDPSRLEISAAVPLGAIARFGVGAPARIVMPAGSAAIEAAVISSPAAVEPGSASAAVRLRPASAAGLTAGMPVDVEILGAEHAGAVLVPSAAIIREGDAVVIVTAGPDGKARRNAVELGVSGPSETEVRKGITPGDRVIVRGQNGLPDGAAVTAQP